MNAGTPAASAAVGSADRSGFATFFAEHHGAVFGFMRARLLDANDAEDLAQEVFVRAYEARERYDRTAAIRPWLMGIGRNVLREHLRRVRRRKETGWTELVLELEEMFGPTASPYEDALALLPACLGQLHESAGQALRWHYLSGEKLDLIAQRMKRTVGAVKVLMVRARQALRRCMEKRGVSGPG